MKDETEILLHIFKPKQKAQIQKIDRFQYILKVDKGYRAKKKISGALVVTTLILIAANQRERQRESPVSGYVTISLNMILLFRIPLSLCSSPPHPLCVLTQQMRNSSMSFILTPKAWWFSVRLP